MRIGISILARSGQSVWQNGIEQNVFFLAACLAEISCVEKVFLIDCGDQGRLPDDANPFDDRFPIVPMSEAPDDLDLVIEMAGGLNVEWLRRLRARGGKAVLHVCGQPYAALVEPTTFDQPGFFSDPTRCDEVWVLPKDRSFIPMLRAIHRCPVHEVPYLWASTFLDYTVEWAAQNGLTFGYRPGDLALGARIAAFEPNISVLKTGIVPLLIAEAAERCDPARIAQFHLLNAQHLENHPTFATMRSTLHLAKADKLHIHDRQYFAPFAAINANLVVSHQINCPQNYLYFDTLSGGYPLVHNSEMFADVGYYYPESDIQAGVAQLHRAIEVHDLDLDFYKWRSQAFIARHAPNAESNRSAMTRRILTLCRTRKDAA